MTPPQPSSAAAEPSADAAHQPWLAAHDALLSDELNVKLVEYTTEADHYIDYQVRPNFKLLGPKLGKRMPAVKQLLERADGDKRFKILETHIKRHQYRSDALIEVLHKAL